MGHNVRPNSRWGFVAFKESYGMKRQKAILVVANLAKMDMRRVTEDQMN